jgi:hypothetical protein
MGETPTGSCSRPICKAPNGPCKEDPHRGYANCGNFATPSQPVGAALREAAERAVAAIDASFGPAHLDGCLFMRDRRMPCQCGSTERTNKAMHEVRQAGGALRAALTDTGDRG